MFYCLQRGSDTSVLCSDLYFLFHHKFGQDPMGCDVRVCTIYTTCTMQDTSKYRTWYKYCIGSMLLQNYDKCISKYICPTSKAQNQGCGKLAHTWSQTFSLFPIIQVFRGTLIFVRSVAPSSLHSNVSFTPVLKMEHKDDIRMAQKCIITHPLKQCVLGNILSSVETKYSLRMTIF